MEQLHNIILVYMTVILRLSMGAGRRVYIWRVGCDWPVGVPAMPQ